MLGIGVSRGALPGPLVGLSLARPLTCGCTPDEHSYCNHVSSCSVAFAFSVSHVAQCACFRRTFATLQQARLHFICTFARLESHDCRVCAGGCCMVFSAMMHHACLDHGHSGCSHGPLCSGVFALSVSQVLAHDRAVAPMGHCAQWCWCGLSCSCCAYGGHSCCTHVLLCSVAFACLAFAGGIWARQLCHTCHLLLWVGRCFWLVVAWCLAWVAGFVACLVCHTNQVNHTCHLRLALGGHLPGAAAWLCLLGGMCHTHRLWWMLYSIKCFDLCWYAQVLCMGTN